MKRQFTDFDYVELARGLLDNFYDPNCYFEQEIDGFTITVSCKLETRYRHNMDDNSYDCIHFDCWDISATVDFYNEDTEEYEEVEFKFNKSELEDCLYELCHN